MTEQAAGRTPDDAMAQRLAQLQARRAVQPPPPVVPSHRSPFRRRRHVAVGARRLAAGAGAAGTLGLVAAMAFVQARTPATTSVTPPAAAVSPGTGQSPNPAATPMTPTTDPSSILPGGRGQPTTTATVPPPTMGATNGSTHGSG